MLLTVIEYADIWDPTESGVPSVSYAPAKIKAVSFLDAFLYPNFSGRIVVWNNNLLRNRRALRIPKSVEFAELTFQEALAKRAQLHKACYSHGHMAVMVAPKNVSEFRQTLLASGYYRQGEMLRFREGDDTQWPWPLPVHEARRKILKEFGLCQAVFTLAHDADSLFEIHCSNS